MERKKRALVGTGLGAIAGGAVGSYQDRQEAQLRAQLDGTGVSVSRIGDNITLNMPGSVTFATDSSDLSPAFFSVLNSVGKVLAEYEQTVVEVAGHTDSTGSDSYNQSLSERRATAVSSYLRGQGVILGRSPLVADGVAAGRLVRLSANAVASRERNYLVSLERGRNRPALRAFRDWLLAEAAG